jgi:PAP2 superfamily
MYLCPTWYLYCTVVRPERVKRLVKNRMNFTSRLVPKFLVKRLAVRLPAAAQVSIFFGVFWLLGLAAGLPLNLPSENDWPFLEFHFFWGVLIAAMLQLCLTLSYMVLNRASGKRRPASLTMIKLFPLIVLSVLLYFNFKAWTPLVNPSLHDIWLEGADEWLAPVLSALIAARRSIATLSPYVNILYSLLYFIPFFLSFGVHGILDPPAQQRQFVIGLCLNLILGGMSYWLMPAIGPFIFRTGENPLVWQYQKSMLELYNQLRATGQLPSGYFTAALGAMPSLHVGHSLFFTLWAARRVRPLLLLYVPSLIWIIIEAPASGWHYLLDLPAGALLAIVSFMLANWLVYNEEALRAASIRDAE